MKRVDASSAWTSPSDLDKKESDGRDPREVVAHRGVFGATGCYRGFVAFKKMPVLLLSIAPSIARIWLPKHGPSAWSTSSSNGSCQWNQSTCPEHPKTLRWQRWIFRTSSPPGSLSFVKKGMPRSRVHGVLVLEFHEQVDVDWANSLLAIKHDVAYLTGVFRHLNTVKSLKAKVMTIIKSRNNL